MRKPVSFRHYKHCSRNAHLGKSVCSRLLSRQSFLAAFAGLALMLAGCASDQSAADLAKAERTLYLEARNALEGNNFIRSLELLEALETKYPLGRFSEQALLEQIYAQFRNQDYETARATADRFIRLHPRHAQVDYAYYMKGMSSYMAGRYMLEGLELIDISERDLGATRDAFSDFDNLLRRFPDSRYAFDARQRMLYIRNVLARREIFIAQFYIRKSGYVAAIKRSQFALENYPTAGTSGDALATLSEAYLHLGMEEEAREALDLLKSQYPKHKQLTSNGQLKLLKPLGEGSKAPWEALIPDVFS
ncbi:outer membrane protein assembly factor BamD [Oceanospirillum sp.]|uniref:outer membrane protein assembly factor BamD n=1 Tax=Oceanospirillum sp. TaxID=2021254 RepID=UPI003A936000